MHPEPIGCEAALYILEIWNELDQGRETGSMETAGLTWPDLGGWAFFHKDTLSSFEVELIFALDAVYIRAVSK